MAIDWGAIGTTVGTTLFLKGVDAITGGSASSSGGGSSSTSNAANNPNDAKSIALRQGQLAQSRADAAERQSQVDSFKALDNVNKFVKNNVDIDAVRNNVIAQLRAQGATPVMISNVLAQWSTADAADVAARETPDTKTGFAQRKIG